VTSILKKVKGVTAVKVDFDSGTATVVADGQIMKTSELLEALEKSRQYKGSIEK
jgi:copper chaperone CopZ